MEQHAKRNEQQPPNPNKKGNEGPKGKEDKPPLAKTKKYKGIPDLTPLAVIPEKNEWCDPD